MLDTCPTEQPLTKPYHLAWKCPITSYPYRRGKVSNNRPGLSTLLHSSDLYLKLPSNIVLYFCSF